MTDDVFLGLRQCLDGLEDFSPPEKRDDPCDDDHISDEGIGLELEFPIPGRNSPGQEKSPALLKTRCEEPGQIAGKTAFLFATLGSRLGHGLSEPCDLPRSLRFMHDEGLRFLPALLEEALTHRSAGARNNERLEFLGDGALNFVIAHELFQRYPAMQEGDLSRLRASLVNGETLASIAVQLDIGDYVRLGTGEKRSGGHRRSSILADCIESIIGAVYCDSDFARCRELILGLFGERLDAVPDPDALKDPKTRLQELLQSRQLPVPEYSVLSVSGKAHQQTFEVRCSIPGLGITTSGSGRSRRKAEQQAAGSAISEVQKQFGQAAS